MLTGATIGAGPAAVGGAAGYVAFKEANDGAKWVAQQAGASEDVQDAVGSTVGGAAAGATHTGVLAAAGTAAGVAALTARLAGCLSYLT